MAQLKDLIVTGSSRFLNDINGTITNAKDSEKLGGQSLTSTYSSTGVAPVTGTAVASALGTLDGTVSGTAGASKTLTAFSQTDGKVSATFGNISITKSQVSDFPTLGTASAKDVPSSGNASTTQVVMGNDTRLSDARTPTSHTHGNIQNGGTLQTNDITIASGDKLVVTDSSDSSKVARTSISFDGSTATKALTQKGTWETFGTSNLTIGTTSSTAMAGNTNVNNVTQTETTTNADYEVLFSGSASDTTETAGVNKNSKLTYNPYDGVLHMFDQGKSITMAPASIGVSQAGNSTVSITQSEISISSYPGNSISLSATGLIGDVTGNVTGNLNGNVKQSATSTSTNNNYPILFSGSTSTSSGQYGINRQAKLTYNPSTNVINLNNDGYMHFRTGSDDSSGYVDIGSGGMGASNSDGTGIVISRSDNNGDVLLSGTNNTWDGTNISLKTAVSSLHNHTGYAALWILQNTSLTTSTNTKVPAANIRCDAQNSDLFSYSNGVLTIKKAGTYFISVTERFNTVTSTKRAGFGLWSNTDNTYVSNAVADAYLQAYEVCSAQTLKTFIANSQFTLFTNTTGSQVKVQYCQVCIIPVWITN